MVFSSNPVYLDPPNWHQQQQNHLHQQLYISEQNPNLPPLPPPPPTQQLSHGGSGSGSGSIRPGSMADRARVAKIPQPEAALKCPRCDSTNTKFCYFNNYSLTQPRHFCKTCRRYWTRGGALRSVPVGGGCRRNKKTKSSSAGSNSNGNNRSKSPATAATTTSSGDPKPGGGGPSGVISPSGSNGGEMIGHFSQNPHHHSFMASIQNLARFGGAGNGGGGLGLSFGEIQGVSGGGGGIGFQIGSGDQILSGGQHQHHSAADQWRLQQHFPLMGGSEFEAVASATANLYPFHQTSGDGNAMVGMMTSSGSRASQFPPVKLEGRPGLNLMSSSRPPSMENSGQFWPGNGGGGGAASWTDNSGLNSASTSHLL